MNSHNPGVRSFVMADSASKIAPFFRDTTTLFQDAAVRDAHRVPEGLSAADLHTIASAVRRLANDPQAEQIRAALAGHAVYSALMSAPVATLDMAQVTPNDIAAMPSEQAGTASTTGRTRSRRRRPL